MATMTLPFSGTLGNIVGPGSDGVLVGAMTATNPTYVHTQSHIKTDGLCVVEDGDSYTTESTDFNSAAAGDVNPLPATPAVGDCFYVGHASLTFAQIDLTTSTQGVGTWTITWKYWDGDSWAALSGVTDGTSGFTSAVGTASVTWTLPGDWAQAPVNDIYGYWVRGEVTAYSAVTTQPALTIGYVIVATADSTFVDDTTDATDAGAGDVNALPTYPVEEDAIIFSYSAKFCMLEMTISQERTGTATITWEYPTATDTWTTLTVDDDSVGFSAGTSTYLVHFEPPSDWVSTAVNSQEGFHIRARLSAKTSVTQQPLLTQVWVYPLATGATGYQVPNTVTFTRVNMHAGTVSGSTADSKFLLINGTSGAYDSFTWTKATAIDTETISLACTAGDHVLLKQYIEDGSTELASASFEFSG